METKMRDAMYLKNNVIEVVKELFDNGKFEHEDHKQIIDMLSEDQVLSNYISDAYLNYDKVSREIRVGYRIKVPVDSKVIK